MHNFTQDKWARTHTFSATCAAPIVKGRILSIIYNIDSYGAGAAHPNHGFQTFCFILEPLTRIVNLQEIFSDETNALKVIINETRRQLREMTDGAGEAIDFDEDSLTTGTTGWADFSFFAFDDNSIRLLFPPYQVAAYAYGPLATHVPYEVVVKVMKPEYKTALGIQYIEYQLERESRA